MDSSFMELFQRTWWYMNWILVEWDYKAEWCFVYPTVWEMDSVHCSLLVCSVKPVHNTSGVCSLRLKITSGPPVI